MIDSKHSQFENLRTLLFRLKKTIHIFENEENVSYWLIYLTLFLFFWRLP